jgi:hypothetical protein
MGKVNLDEIKPGMKLEKDVQERSGKVLLRAVRLTGSKPELESFQQLLKERLNPVCATS